MNSQNMVEESRPETKLRIGMLQLLVIPGDLKANLAAAYEMLGAANNAACNLAILPECFDLGWADISAQSDSSPVPGFVSEQLAKLAIELNLHILAGVSERDGDEVFNAALLISDSGEILARHRKINELDFAREIYAVGSQATVAKTKFGLIGINICADNWDENIESALKTHQAGAQMLLSPCAWAVSPDHDNEVDPYGGTWLKFYQKIAEQTAMPVVAVSNVGRIKGGPWGNWKCIGNSIAISGTGEVLKVATHGEFAQELNIIEIELVGKSI